MKNLLLLFLLIILCPIASYSQFKALGKTSLEAKLWAKEKKLTFVSSESGSGTTLLCYKMGQIFIKLQEATTAFDYIEVDTTGKNPFDFRLCNTSSNGITLKASRLLIIHLFASPSITKLLSIKSFNIK